MGPLVVVADLAALIDPASGHSLTSEGTVLTDDERRYVGPLLALALKGYRAR